MIQRGDIIKATLDLPDSIAPGALDGSIGAAMPLTTIEDSQRVIKAHVRLTGVKYADGRATLTYEVIDVPAPGRTLPLVVDWT